MLQLIATIFVIYLIWLLIRPMVYRYAQRKYRERISDMFGKAFGDAFAGPQPGGKKAPQPQPQKRKVYSKEEGEYVEFEEVEITVEYTETTTAEDGYTPREPQVSDADWEEIK